MTTFSKRVTASGEVTYQAKCRRKGHPTQSKTFKTLADAKKWARQIERAFDTGEGLAAPARSDTTLADVLRRYREDVCPTLRGGDLEAQRINIWLREWSFTKTPINQLSPSVLATYRDARLRQVSAGTVLRELNILWAALNRARINWGIPIPDVQIKRPKAPAPRDRRLKPGEEERLLKGALRQCASSGRLAVLPLALSS